jgi:hypothetical protein
MAPLILPAKAHPARMTPTQPPPGDKGLAQPGKDRAHREGQVHQIDPGLRRGVVQAHPPGPRRGVVQAHRSAPEDIKSPCSYFLPAGLLHFLPENRTFVRMPFLNHGRSCLLSGCRDIMPKSELRSRWQGYLVFSQSLDLFSSCFVRRDQIRPFRSVQPLLTEIAGAQKEQDRNLA